MFGLVPAVLSDSIVITDANVKSVIARSYNIPVFMVFHSEHCAHCREILPEWERFMQMYANKTGIVVAELSSSSNRQAVQEIMPVSSYPTFAELIRGKCTILSIGRGFQSYVDHAEVLRKTRIETTCEIWETLPQQRYPSFVFSTKSGDENSCKTITSICNKVGLGPERCFLSKNSSTKPTVAVYYSATLNVTIDAETTSKLTTLVSDFTREPWGDWDVRTIKRSTRRAVLLIYGFTYQIIDAKKAGNKYVKDLLMGRISIDDFRAIVPQIRISELDTPAYLISDKNKKKFTILTAIGRKLDLRADFEELLLGRYDERMEYKMNLLVRGGKEWIYGLFGTVLVLFFVFEVVRRRRSSKRE